jgi:hypothetical protein
VDSVPDSTHQVHSDVSHGSHVANSGTGHISLRDRVSLFACRQAPVYTHTGYQHSGHHLHTHCATLCSTLPHARGVTAALHCHCQVSHVIYNRLSLPGEWLIANWHCKVSGTLCTTALWHGQVSHVIYTSTLSLPGEWHLGYNSPRSLPSEWRLVYNSHRQLLYLEVIAKLKPRNIQLINTHCICITTNSRPCLVLGLFPLQVEHEQFRRVRGRRVVGGGEHSGGDASLQTTLLLALQRTPQG